MKTRKLGYTSLNLSVVDSAPGRSPIRPLRLGPQSDKDTIATVQRAMEVGVNWIDARRFTAWANLKKPWAGH